MEMSYDKTYQIELLNEFSMSIYNRILRYAMKNNIDLESESHFISIIFRQMEENLSVKLFDKSMEELEEIRKYWEHMNIYTKEITGIKEVA